MYQRAVREVLDMCGSQLYVEGEFTPEQKQALNGAAPKSFNHLYTVYGDSVTSILNIDEDTSILVAGDKSKFKGLKTNQLFKVSETASDMLNRIVEQSPINFDSKSNAPALSATVSKKTLESPFKHQRSNESLGTTFALTQQDAISQSPIRNSKQKAAVKVKAMGRNHKRAVSLTSRDIIKASKAELANKNFTIKGTLSQRASGVSLGGTLQAKRLASINAVTKGIKRGQLPPIKTPTQLDVFVFGEKPKPQLHSGQHSPIEESARILKAKVQRTLTIAETANENSIEQDNVSMVQTESSGMEMRKRRGTEAQLRTREQYVDSMKEKSIVSSLPEHSSMGLFASPNGEFEYSEQESLNKKGIAVVSLRKQLDQLNSIQMNGEEAVSCNTYHSQPYPLQKPKQKINKRNVKIAKIAIKERSPSYSNSKLVSQTSMTDLKSQKSITMKLTERQKDKLKAEANEHVMTNAIKQRKQWREEYKLNDKLLFRLFSEFSSMMQINRMQVNEGMEESVAQRMAHENAKTGETDEKMLQVFPMGASVSSTKYNLMRQEEKHKNYKLNMKDYRDFRVPVKVFIDYSEVLRPMKLRLRRIVLNAFGILADYEKTALSMEEFLHISSFLRFGHNKDDDFMWFCVKLFDPKLEGYTKVDDCEDIIDLLFDNQDDEDAQKKKKMPVKPQSKQQPESDNQGEGIPESAGEEVKVPDELNISNNGEGDQLSATPEKQAVKEKDGVTESGTNDAETSKEDESAGGRAKVATLLDEAKDESVSANIKKVCYERGVFKADGFLDQNLLYQCFKDSHLDIADFKSGLQ